MAVRVLLVLAVFAVLYGCGQASSPVEKQEKQGDVEQAEKPKPKTVVIEKTVVVEKTDEVPAAVAQAADTIYDEAGVLSDPEEQQVQVAFDQTEEEAGQPLYAFLVLDTGVQSQGGRIELLEQVAQEENVPQDAGVIMVAPDDGWAQLANIDGVSEDAVYEAMVPDFQEGDFAAGLRAGAEKIRS